MSDFEAPTLPTVLVLRPNSSLSSFASRAILVSLTVVILLISITFSVLGYWMILPFAGLELAVLYWVFVKVIRQSKRVERIEITEKMIEISSGIDSEAKFFCFRRDRASLEVLPGTFRGHPSRLLLHSPNRHVEIGEFLAETERLEVAKRLRTFVPGMASERLKRKKKSLLPKQEENDENQTRTAVFGCHIGFFRHVVWQYGLGGMGAQYAAGRNGD